MVWPAFLLLLWTPAGLLHSVDWERSWHGIGFVALGLTLFFALLNWPPAQRRPWLVAAMVGLIGMGLALLGPALLPTIPQKLFLFSEELSQSQPANYLNTGETINPNVLAGGLLLPIPLLAILALRNDWARKRWLPLLLLVPTLLILTMLLLTQSRGAYLAVTISLLVVLTLRWPWTGLIVVIAAVAAGSVLSWDGVWFFVEAIGSDGALTNLSGRSEVWNRALQAIRDFALTGIGIGTFDLVIPVLYPYEELVNGIIHHAHNLFLQVTVDLGVPGLLLYLWLLGGTGWILIRMLRGSGEGTSDVALASPAASRHAQRSERRRQRRQAALHWALVVGDLAALIAMLVHGLVDAVTWGTKLSFIAWLLFALAGLLYNQEQQPGEL